MAVVQELNYFKMHREVYRQRGKASSYTCAMGSESARDWALIHGMTGNDPVNDFIPLCRHHHMLYDGHKRGIPHSVETKAKIAETSLGRRRRGAA